MQPTITGLRVVAGPATGCTVVLTADVTLGRDEHPDGVSFEGDADLSRRHAQVHPLPNGAAVVEDLGSSNGTFVNGERIEIPRLLASGDQIRVGQSVLVLTPITRDAGGGTTVPAPPPTPPPTPPPAPAPPTPAQRRGRGKAWLAALAAVVVAFVVGVMAGGRGHPDAAGPGIGTVYVESGSAQPGANTVIAFRYRAGGDLHPLAITAFPTGGAGAFDLTNTGALDADGQIVTSTDGRLLFAVNQGSDTVAVFQVHGDGGLGAVKGSPFASGGLAPAGLALAGDRLVVVNKAQDGVRDLHAAAPGVTTFLVGTDGALRPTGSTIQLPPGTSPTEVLITPGGRVVVVPEEHGPLVSLTLGPTGQLRPAPGSPTALPGSIFPPGFPTSQRWALGLANLPAGGFFYAQVVDTAQLVVYRYDGAGHLTFVRAVADPGAYLPCWSLVNAAGTRLYTDNAGNNTMSVFDIADPSAPRLLQVVTVKNAGNPWDLRMDPTGHFLFVLDARDRADLVPAGQGNELHTLLVGPDGMLTEPAYSPVPIPVPLNTNPIGLAVVAH